MTDLEALKATGGGKGGKEKAAMMRRKRIKLLYL